MYPTLTLEQFAALDEYARQHGRCWKQKLGYLWQHGAYSTGSDIDATVYGLRNSHGPSWLKGFVFLAAAKDILRQVNVTITPRPESEWRVNLDGGTEETASYQTDIVDAVSTGLAMAQHRDLAQVWIPKA